MVLGETSHELTGHFSNISKVVANTRKVLAACQYMYLVLELESAVAVGSLLLAALYGDSAKGVPCSKLCFLEIPTVPEISSEVSALLVRVLRKLTLSMT